MSLSWRGLLSMLVFLICIFMAAKIRYPGKAVMKLPATQPRHLALGIWP